jgi:hypothetical protein
MDSLRRRYLQHGTAATKVMGVLAAAEEVCVFVQLLDHCKSMRKKKIKY